LGRYDSAIEELRKADGMYSESGAARQHVEVLNDLGDVYLSIGDVASAEQQFDAGLTSATKIGYSQGAQIAAISFADIERRRGQFEKARARLISALQRARSSGDDASAVTVLLQLASLEREQKHYSVAAKNAAAAVEIARRIGAPLLEAHALGAQAENLLAADDSAAAFTQLREAQALAKDLSDTELKWRLDYAEGRALEASRQFEAAVQAYRHAVEQIESVRDQLREERFRAGYLQSRYDVYIALVRLLVKLHRFDDAFSYSERLRARSYVDILTRDASSGSAELAELRARIRRLQSAILAGQTTVPSEHRSAANTYSEELAKAEARYQEIVDDLLARQPGLSLDRGLMVSSSKQVGDALPSGAALLEYVVGPSSTSLLCVTQQGVHGTSIPVTSANLTAKVELLRDLISRADRDDWRGPAASLYQQLVGPAASAGWLRGVRRLYIVPHGILHYLPFAVLLDKPGPEVRFLVQQYSIKQLPSASLLAADRKPPTSLGKLLSVAPARARLRFATQEAESVARLFPAGSFALVGEHATKHRFTRLAGNYDLLHLATHGYFNRLNPMFSGIQLQPDGADDGTLHVYEILALQLHARLVTLSACETALGSGFFSDLPPGDEFVGLTRAFLSAGGQSVLATLWEVNDRSTIGFMLDFYRRAGGQDSATALATVQRAMAEKGPYRHPYYWAAFVLSGVGK
jgi:CHAT domain-containing protein